MGDHSAPPKRHSGRPYSNMSNDRSSSVLVLVAFVAGVAAGVALAWLLEGDPDATSGRLTAERDAASERAPAEPGLVAKGTPQPMGRSVPPDSAASAASPLPAPPFEPPAELDLPPGVAGWIRVEVVPPAGQSDVGGEVYVLAAGAPGVDDIDLVPHGDAYTSEPAQMAVARPGRYDVGLVIGQIQLLQTNVSVVAGETTTVVFRVPVAEGVTVTLEDPLPEVPGWTSQMNLRFVPLGAARHCTYPGRGEGRNLTWGWTLRKRTMTAGSILPGQRYRVSANLTRYQAKPKPLRLAMAEHFAVCSPEQVGPGSHVRIRIRRSGVLSLRAVLEPTSWPVGVEQEIHVAVDHAGGSIHRSYLVEHDDVEEGTRYTWTFRAPAGPVIVRWRGTDIQSGVLEGLAVRAGERLRLEADIRYTGRAPSNSRPPRLEVAWPPSMDGDEHLDLAGVWRRAHGELDVSTSSFGRRDDVELDARFRTARGLIAVIGQQWATGPLEITGDALRVRPVRGGLVVIAPEVTRPESMGYLLLRRPDGLPIPRPEEGWDLAVRAETGRVLGPLAPGEHTFQVWLGSRRLPDAKVTVRAGRTTPLVIPE